MENIDFATLFQGIGTMMESGWLLASARVFLVLISGGRECSSLWS